MYSSVRVFSLHISLVGSMFALFACQSSTTADLEREAEISVDLNKIPAQLRRRLREGEDRLLSMRAQREKLAAQVQSLLILQDRYRADSTSSQGLLEDVSARVNEAESQVKLIDRSISEINGLVERIKLSALADELRANDSADNQLTEALQNAAEVYEELGELTTLQGEAKLGNPEAQFKLGRRLERGEGIEQSEIEALEWYEAAAAQGHKRATLAAGFFYRHGKGTTANLDKAIAYYRQAADLGEVTAANNLGHIYNKGVEGAKDYVNISAAKRWFAVAATGGLNTAQLSLAKIYIAEAKTLRESETSDLELVLKKMKRARVLLKRAQRSRETSVGEEAKSMLASMSPLVDKELGEVVRSETRWINIPGGQFSIGDPSRYEDAKPIKEIKLKAFYLSATEVTVESYQRCVESGHCSPPKRSKRGCTYYRSQASQMPINCVTWAQAREYAQWVGGDLPSEAQWEYAARSAGVNARYPWGEQETSCQRAIIRLSKKGVSKTKVSRAKGCGKGKPWPVCSKPDGMSQQGLCDMIGNVWEWTLDEYRPTYESLLTNGRPVCSETDCSATQQVHRVLRGGAYMTKVTGASATMRSKSNRAAVGIGFRVAKAIEEATTLEESVTP